VSPTFGITGIIEQFTGYYVLWQTGKKKNIQIRQRYWIKCYRVEFFTKLLSSNIYPRRRQLRGKVLPPFACASVCFSARYLKKSIIKHNTEMFQDESWKLIYFGVKRPKFKATRHTKRPVPACVFALLWVLASSIFHLAIVTIDSVSAYCSV